MQSIHCTQLLRTECSDLSLCDSWLPLSLASIAALPPPKRRSKRRRVAPSLARRELMTEYMDSFDSLNAVHRRNMADTCRRVRRGRGRRELPVAAPRGPALHRRMMVAPGSSGTAGCTWLERIDL